MEWQKVNGFRVRINLDSFYPEGDFRRTQALWVTSEHLAGTVAMLEKTLCQVIGIPGNVRLLVENMLLPRGEPAAIVGIGDCLTVIPEPEEVRDIAKRNDVTVISDAERSLENEAPPLMMPARVVLQPLTPSPTSPPLLAAKAEQQGQCALQLSHSAVPPLMANGMSQSHPKGEPESIMSLSEAKQYALRLDHTLAPAVSRRRRTRRRPRPKPTASSIDRLNNPLRSKHTASESNQQSVHIIFNDESMASVSTNNNQLTQDTPDDLQATPIASDDDGQSTHGTLDCPSFDLARDEPPRSQSPTTPSDDLQSLSEAKQRALLLLERTVATTATPARRRTRSRRAPTTPTNYSRLRTHLASGNHMQSTHVAPDHHMNWSIEKNTQTTRVSPKNLMLSLSDDEEMESTHVIDDDNKQSPQLTSNQYFLSHTPDNSPRPVRRTTSENCKPRLVEAV